MTSRVNADQPYLGTIRDVTFQPVFLLGLHRSGTSLLYKLLAETRGFNVVTAYHLIHYDELMHNRVSGREPVVKEHLNRQLYEHGQHTRQLDTLRVSADFPEEYSFALARRTLYRHLSARNLPLLRELAGKIQFLSGPDKPLLLKNPFDFANFLYLKRTFPHAKFLFIHRHPLRVISSAVRAMEVLLERPNVYTSLLSAVYRRFWQYPHLTRMVKTVFRPDSARTVLLLTCHAARALAYYRTHIGALPATDYVTVRYEDLCASPQQHIATLLEALACDASLPYPVYTDIAPRAVALITTDGDIWQHQRQTANPGFAYERIMQGAPNITRLAEDVLTAWRDHARSGRPVEVHQTMMRLTLRVMGEILLGVDLTSKAEAVGQALADALHEITHRNYAMLPLPLAIPTPHNARLRQAVRTLHDIAEYIVDTHAQQPYHNDNLLSLLLAARTDRTPARRDPHLRDQIITLILTGHESTANALTWTWYLLATHPHVLRQLRRELHETLQGRTPTAADLSQLTYGKQVLQEAMRLYPPVWLIQRRAMAADIIGGYRLPAGSVLFLSPYVTHRHPAFWQTPETFKPQHFDADAVAARPRFAYFPFGGGPRVCIGAAFAMLEAGLILATLAQRFDLVPVPEHPVVMQPLATLRPKHGIRMIVHEHRG